MIAKKTPRYSDGILLRVARIRQGKEQKEVCTGICAVSTLSKIETGRQKADTDMLRALYKELGIQFETDEKFLHEMKEYILQFFEQYSYKYDMASWEILKKNSDRLMNSPLAIDLLIISALMGKQDMGTLHDCYPYMSTRQRGWYNLIDQHDSLEESIPRKKEAIAILQNSVSYFYLSSDLYEAGCFREILHMTEAWISFALEEGNLWALGNAYLMRGTVYACLDMDSMMMEEYKKTIHLFQNTGWKDLVSTLYYNIGATYLSLGEYSIAEEYLLKKTEDEFLKYHKLALLYARTNRHEEAKMMILKMNQFIMPHTKGKDMKQEDTQMMEKILKLTILENQRGWERNPEFIEILEQFMGQLKKAHWYGFMHFYRETLKRAYREQRLYKKALELEESFSEIRENMLSK